MSAPTCIGERSASQAAPCLREPAPPARGQRAGLLYVSGGKGGVGKTLLAANLAARLAWEGRRVLLVDLDLGLGDLALALRVAPERTLEDALAGRARLADCRVRGACGLERLDLLAASSGTPAMGRLAHEQRARLLRELRELGAGYELIVADGAAGLGPDVLDFAAEAERVLVVTTPQLAARSDAYGLLKALGTRADERGRELATPELVINRAPSLAAAESCAERLQQVCRRFLSRAPRWAGWLPECAALGRSLDEQRPFALRADARASEALARGALERLARRVLPARASVPA